MDKRIKNKLCLVTFFVLLCLLFLPSHPVYAYFSDAISENIGINLTLGSVDLSVENDVSNETTTGHTLKSENNKVDLKSLVKNNGTLSGKLAYKVNLTKADGTSISNDLLQSINLKINGEDVKINNQYNLVANVNSNPLILDPTESKDFLIQMEVTDFSNQNESIKIQIEFLLFQTNGTIEIPLFHDKETVSYAFEIEKEEVVTPPKEDNEEYWPTNGWKDKGNIRYNLEDYSPIMYFSEIAETTKIKNLNDIIIYIEIKDSEGVASTGPEDLNINEGSEGVSIVVSHVNGNKQHLKVSFSIDSKKFKGTGLSNPMNYYSIASKWPNKEFLLTSNDIPITFKRILLSTDYVEGRDYSPRPINLFSEERKIYLAQSDQDYYNYLETPLKNISFDDKVKVSVSTQGNNENSVQIGKDATGNAQFTLQSVNTIEKVMAGPQLTVLLTGTSGATLEVKRETQLLPNNSQIPWPEKMDKEWGIPDKEGKYNQTVSIDLIENNGKMISKNDFFIYVKNPYKEELQFSMSDSKNYIIQNIGYNSTGDYMRIALKFVSSDLNEHSFPWGFIFSIQNEISTKHIDDTEIQVSYNKMVVAKQQQLDVNMQEKTSFISDFNIEQQIIQPLKNGDTELYIYYDQLVSDYDLVNVKEKILDYLNNHNSTLTFELEDDPNSKAVKLIIQK